jgi:CPA1 family monovalent cation:H+ antiporter
VVFVLNALVFILIGLQLDGIAERLAAYSGPQLLWLATCVSAAAIAIRMIWVFPNAYLPMMSASVRAREGGVPPVAWVAIVGWTGMRGVVSLAAALAIPQTMADGSAFPARDLVVFLSFAVIFSTLVLQGTTLGPLIRGLGVGGDRSFEREEESARRKLAHAALSEIDRLAAEDLVAMEVAPNLRRVYEARMRAEKPTQHDREFDAARRQTRRVRLAVVAAERRRLLKLRREREIGDDVLHKLMREVDLEEMRLASRSKD